MRASGHGKRVLWLLVVTTLIALPSMADEAYRQAKSNIESGHIDLALEQLKRAVKREADNYQAWFLLGVAYTRGQQFHQAMESFRRVIEINPKLAEPHYNLAVIYNELGDYRAAINELERSLIKKPGDAVAEENLADLYLKLALENYRSALNKAPSQALEERYMRLLKVRDPQRLPDLTEKPLVSIPVAETERIKEGAAVTSAKSSQITALNHNPPGEPLLFHNSPSGAEAQRVVTGAKKSQRAKIQAPVVKKTVKEKIQEAVEVWRNAWSEQDVELYFSMYAPDFQVPERFGSVGLWKQYKRQAIASKSYLHVELSDLKITVDLSGKRASIDFFQKFRSNSYNGDDFKRLEMKLYNSEWKIVSEVSVL